MQKISRVASETLLNLKIYKSYRTSRFLSVKHSSYFQVYEELFSKLVGKQITFVEIGILNGGSLFMWRDYFGSQARVIGIDMNPAAKRWEDDGFEVFIGDQSDPKFWDSFFSAVGKVDVVLDDGGHTNRQQIVTADKCIPNINDNGVLVIEDVHTSYFGEFGNPSKYSFISFAKNVVDGINSRFPRVLASGSKFNQWVYSVSFFESIVCFHIDRCKCFICSPMTNDGITLDAEDYRSKSIQKDALIATTRAFLGAYLGFLKAFGPLKRSARMLFEFLQFKAEAMKLRKYFK